MHRVSFQFEIVSLSEETVPVEAAVLGEFTSTTMLSSRLGHLFAEELHKHDAAAGVADVPIVEASVPQVPSLLHPAPI